jgi:signal transduction histidine kinase
MKTSEKDLKLANIELAFQNKEKDKRAAELVIAKEEKSKRAAELVIANKELAFQNKEKDKRANELVLANIELAFQNKEKDKRAYELTLANEEKEKRADELKQILLKLEERVKERTLNLQKTHEQLLHAEKMSSIGRLSASIAHEFNNPLQGVTNIIQGVKKRADLDIDDSELMDLALKECHRMRDLVKSLQVFNRQTTSIKASVDIHATLDNILMLSKKEFATRKVSITKKYIDNLPQITVVSDQLKQVFLNMLSNASDAYIHGGVITIETDFFENNVVIRFHDSGCGLSPDDRERIFEPFFTTKSEMKGTGLGLSISYGIIKDHGGEITVDSEQNKGSTFSVILPIKEGGSDEKK